MGAFDPIVVIGSHSDLMEIANLLTLLASVGVAAGAAWWSIREARRNQEHSELTVSPAINSERHANENEEILGLKIANVGNGPAIVDSIYFVHRGVAIDITGDQAWFVKLDQLLQREFEWMVADVRGMKMDPAGMTNGTVIGAGAEQWIASQPREALSLESLAQFQRFILNSSVVVFYRSVHARRYNNIDAYMPQGNMDTLVKPIEVIAGRFPRPQRNVEETPNTAPRSTG